jgi:hypothetical protein
MRLTSFAGSQALLLLDSRLNGRSRGGFRVDHVGCGRSGEWSQKVLQSEHIILGSRRVAVVIEGEEYRDYAVYVTEYSEVSTHGDEVVDGGCEREVVCKHVGEVGVVVWRWCDRSKEATHRLRIKSRGIT